MDQVFRITEVDQPRSVCRILVVDDSPVQRSILAATLNFYGFEVTEASSGTEALNICEKVQPDLVLSDWIMPGMDGLEFCQAFRALDARTYAYFILLTAMTDKEYVAHGLQVGADDFLLKPVNTPELIARITAGDRILRMQRELSEKNRVISDTLSALQKAHDLLDEDLHEAKKLQQSLVRRRHLTFQTGAVSMTLHSAGHVGGDLVGHYPIDADRVGLFAIDVSGHGVSSALMTARLAGYLSSTVPEQNIAMKAKGRSIFEPIPPENVLSDLNALFLEDMETDLYFTMLLAEVNVTTGQAKLAQAGHPHPIVQRADGAVQLVGTGGVPIGLVCDARYESFEVTLSPGDRLFILSDGAAECRDPTGQMLGDERLAQLLTDLKSQHGESCLEALIWHLQEHSGAAGFDDDISGILWEYSGPPD